MSTWRYQFNAQDWSPETFRYEIWEGKPWHWRYGKKLAKALINSRGSAEIAEEYRRSYCFRFQ